MNIGNKLVCVTLVFGMTLLAVSEAKATECPLVPLKDTLSNLKRTGGYVFSGTVVDISVRRRPGGWADYPKYLHLPAGLGPLMTIVTLDVDRYWVGSVQPRMVVQQWFSQQPVFVAGGRYVVFVSPPYTLDDEYGDWVNEVGVSEAERMTQGLLNSCQSQTREEAATNGLLRSLGRGHAVR